MAKRPCANPGCPNLVFRGYCETCAPKHSPRARIEAARPSAAKRGYGRRWQALRESYFRRNPFCADPYGAHGEIMVLASDLDHVDPHKGDMEKFWDVKNLQGLCKECHSRKTATEDSQFAHCTSGRHINVTADRISRKDGRMF